MTVRTLFLLVFVLTMAACHSLRPISTDSSSSSSKERTRTSSRSTTPKSTTSKKTSQLRKDIIKYALRKEGSKYKYGAKGPSRFDCSGFTVYVYDANDVTLPSGSYNQARLGKKVSLSKAQPGDLVFFGKGGKVNHVALIIGNSSEGLEVIHSTSSRGVIRENVSKSSYWKPRILYARNVIGS